MVIYHEVSLAFL